MPTKAVAKTTKKRVRVTRKRQQVTPVKVDGGDDKPSIVGYRDGANGFIRWVEEFVWIKIYPETSTIPVFVPMSAIAAGTPVEVFGEALSTLGYKRMWDLQKLELQRALVMKNGRFKHRLIVFCWQRGDGKSLITCFIQLWKFFCFPKQIITLGANSKDQTKFVHFDIMTETIQNSPKLLRIVGERNLQTNKIILRDKRGYIASSIQSISSFSGIVSNITGYTFSEMFDMKNPKFFTQLDGSTRNIPNALGVIDSTVSSKTHILYKLYESFVKGEDPTTFFSYRSSQNADPKDFMNPNMTQLQLNSYKSKFLPADFDRYFKNVWSAGTDRMFSEELAESLEFIGVDGVLGQQKEIIALLEEKNETITTMDKLIQSGITEAMISLGTSTKIDDIYRRLWKMDSVASMTAPGGLPMLMPASALNELGRMYKTDWVILSGFDRGDPMKDNRSAARTMLSFVAKGLIGSKNNLYMYTDTANVPEYFYVLLYMANIANHSMEDVKKILKDAGAEYDGVDMFCSERWGAWDIPEWCETQGIACELVYPTYDRQREAFTEFYIACRDGRFKAPSIPIKGSKGDMDIFREELSVFDHNPDPPRWFGSPEKKEKYGIQDDSVYSVAWGIHGGRELTVENFREIRGSMFFGTFHPDKTLVGAYA